MKTSKFIFVGLDGRQTMKNTFRHITDGSGELVIRRNYRDGTRFYQIFKNGNTDAPERSPFISGENSIVIRFGTREVIPTNSHTLVYNQAWHMRSASNKKAGRETCNMNGVRVPKIVNPGNFDSSDLPIIARPSYHHQGKNLVVLETYEDFLSHYNEHYLSGWYYSKYIKKQHEYRVHVAHGKILAIMEKPAPDDKNKIAWNQAQQDDHEAFTNIRWNRWNEPAIKDVIIQAIAASNALKLDFAGVDVMTNGKTAYILEVNTAPSFAKGDYVSGKYARYFKALFSSDRRIPHVVVSSSDMVDYAWKNEELDALGR